MRLRAAFLFSTCFACIACGGGSYQQFSAGSVGCPMHEIKIRDVSSGTDGETWTAHCRGLTYYCSKTEEMFGHPLARHDAKCTVSSAPTNIPDPPRARFSPGIASKKDGHAGHTLLRVTLGSDGLRAMFVGKPDRDPTRVEVILARKAPGTIYEGCRNLDYVSGEDTGSLSGDVKYGRLVQDAAQWETLTTTIDRAKVGAIAAADSAQLKACSDVIDLNQAQVVLLRAFLQRWDDAARRAPPAASPPPAPAPEQSPAPADPPIAAAAATAPIAATPPGCQYDTQCKGERICVEGRCTAPPASAPK
jgi:hypothetical protein